MITVIDENRYDYEGQYDNMTLAEAGEQLIIDITESANEFQMGVLLFEHSYLYETGNEIDYLTEAEGRENIIKRFIGWVKDKAWPAIRDFFKRAEDAIYEFFASTIPSMFNKMGLTKKKFDEILKSYKGSGRCTAIKTWVNYENLKDASSYIDSSDKGVIFSEKDYETKRGKTKSKTVIRAIQDDESKLFTNKYKKENYGKNTAKKKYSDELDSFKGSLYTEYPDGIEVTSDVLKEAGNIIFNKNTILRDISKAKNNANTLLNSYIRKVKTVKDDDQVAAMVNEYTLQIKENTKVYRAVVKYYTMHVSNCAKAIRFAASSNRKDNRAAKKNGQPDAEAEEEAM